MEKSREHSRESRARLRAAVMTSALAIALIEAGMVLFEGVAQTNPGGLVPGVLSSFMLVFFALAAGGLFLIGVLGRATGEEALVARLAWPWQGGARLWSGQGGDEQRVQSLRGLYRIMLTALLYFGAMLWVSLLTLREFHEPVRMSILIAAAGVALAWPVSALARALVDKAVSSARLKGPALGKRLRIALLAPLVIGAAAAALALINKEAAFGAFDPYPFVLLVLFVLLVSACCFARVRPLQRLGARYASLLAGLSLVAAVTLLSLSADARGTVGQKGRLSAVVYGSLYRLLDMDGDGSAWLVGGDCRPFDASMGPFAEEVPGNGRDENCDGLDSLSNSDAYVDPLDELPPPPSGMIRKGGNVLVVISDATPARHLALYGNRQDIMPSVTRFASRAVVFDNFFAVANHTSVAMAALLTGLFPSSFARVRESGWNSLPMTRAHRPIQVRLGAAGYSSYTTVGHKLYSIVRYFDHLGRGKDRRLAGREVSRIALRELRKIGPRPEKPVLYVVHFIDPHHPYDAPENPTRFGRRHVQKFRAELAYVDTCAKPLLDLMQEDGFKDWLVVFTSDHGEGFGEHGTFTHGHSLYDEEVRVPLVMRIPGVGAKSIPLAAGHLDLVPTISQWCGVAAEEGLPGRSLLSAVAHADKLDGSRRFVFSEFFRIGDRFAVNDGRYSLIYRKEQDRFEQYDGKTDPMQKHDMFGTSPDRKMEAMLKAHIKASLRRLGDQVF